MPCDTVCRYACLAFSLKKTAVTIENMDTEVIAFANQNSAFCGNPGSATVKLKIDIISDGSPSMIPEKPNCFALCTNMSSDWL